MGAHSISQVHGSHSWLVLLLVKLQLYHWPRTFFVNVRSKTSDRALDNPEPKALIHCRANSSLTSLTFLEMKRGSAVRRGASSPWTWPRSPFWEMLGS